MAAIRFNLLLSSSSSSSYVITTTKQLNRTCSFDLHNSNGGFTNLTRVYSGKHASGSVSKTTSFAQLIESLIERRDLTEDEAEESLDYLLQDANEALISAFLVLLRAKGETYEEVVGLAKAMIKHCKKVEGLGDVVDIVGTGGDGANTVNISTGSSILAAACGTRVAKQGSRSSSSACGSADVLEELSVAIELDPE
ncbi:anthranilate phosphoribosyltransferase, chloroplastic-like, partial [Bidens hawaiensis]|uniref:anthranilate phosphoribosyltransferase, chloroplastic-like n=1 Tax=Bidens hawaiensis TaxID=980011 RepID=UPI00404A2656